MKLYGYWRSSSAWRVRIALHHKQLSFENIPVHLVNDGGQQRKPEHTARNPMAQVPVLAVEHLGEEHHLSQSLAILEYLEETHPEPALLPRDPVQRAKARQLAEMVNSGIQPLQNLRVLVALQSTYGVDRLVWGRSVIADGLAAVEAVAQHTSGAFLVGDTPSFADLCLVPQLYNARRFSVDLEPLPTLRAIEARCEALPAFAAAHPSQQPDAVHS